MGLTSVEEIMGIKGQGVELAAALSPEYELCHDMHQGKLLWDVLLKVDKGQLEWWSQRTIQRRFSVVAMPTIHGADRGHSHSAQEAQTCLCRALRNSSP